MEGLEVLSSHPGLLVLNKLAVCADGRRVAQREFIGVRRGGVALAFSRIGSSHTSVPSIRPYMRT